MSDLVSRLRTFPTLRPEGPEAADRIVALEAEVERLRGLVREASIEGFEQHCVDFHYQNTPPESEMAWGVSDSRAALAGEGTEIPPRDG